MPENKSDRRKLSHKKNDMYRSMMETTGDVYMRFDSEFRHIYVSPTAAAYSGMEPDAMTGKTHRELGFPENLCRFWEERLSDIFRSGNPVETEFEFNSAKGPVIFNWRLYPEHDDAGTITTVLSVARDMTRIRLEQQEKENLMRFQNIIIESADIWLDVLDREGNVIIWNRAAERISGYSAGEATGHGKIWEWLYPDEEYRKNITATAMEIIEGLRVAEGFETTIRCKNGEERIISWNSRNLVDDRGIIMGSVALGFDVTEKNLIETALKESEEHYRNIFENAEAGLFRTRILDGKVLDVNEKYAQLAGYDSREECLSEFVSSKSYADPRQREYIIQELKEKGFIQNKEIEIIQKNGSRIWVSFSARVFPEDGLIEGVLIDVTERINAVRALKESESLYRSLFEGSRDGIIFIDGTGQFLDFNQSYLDMLGYSRNELLAMNFRMITPEKWLGWEFETVFEKQLRVKGYSDIYEKEYIHKDGSVFPVELRAYRLNKPGSGSEVFWAIVRDITEEKKAREEHRLLQEQFFQAQKMEAIGTLTGGLAHDFNNILGGIIGSLSILEMILAEESLKKEEKIWKYLRTAISSSNRAAETIKQLLMLTRRESLRLVPVDITQSLRNVIRICQNSFPKSINIDSAFPDKPVRIMADPTQLEQLILNLCVNASHAMTSMRGDHESEGGILFTGLESLLPDVRIMATHGETKQGYPYAVLTIRDNGIGMDQETQNRIFEPFFTTKPMGSGTGLGLAMVYSIVTQHGGLIDVRSEPGSGTEIKVYFPLLEDEAHPQIFEPGTPPADIPRGNGLIMVVDDEEALRSIAVEILEGIGYRVITAENGLKAMEIFQVRHTEIDALVLDMSMPGMSGLELYKNIRLINPSIRVILTSGYMHDERVRKAMDLGALGFIAKPYSIRHFAEKVRELLFLSGK
jgi:PAS domain S-box-containing protein